MAQIIFVTSASELGFFNTKTNEAEFAAFTNRSYTDVAVAPDGQIYASSFTSLYKLNLTGTNVGEQFIGSLGNSSVNALDFTNDGLLVGAGGRELFAFDTASGIKSTIANLPYSSSGDLEILGNSVYISLTDGRLHELDLATGAGLSDPISTPYSTWGLSFSEEVLYGFAGDDVAAFNLTDGSYEFVDQQATAFDGAYYGSSSNGVIRFESSTDDANRIVGGDLDESFDGGLSNDTIVGGDGDDTILGGAGDDQIWAGSEDTGNDSIEGGTGNDTLGGSAGNDTIKGDQGADIIFGGSGADFGVGGSEDDLIWMGSGRDLAEGGQGNDIVGGGVGNDTLEGGAGDDVLYGSFGVDSLDGGLGSDLMFGGDGDDTLIGGGDNDTMYGGLGDDVFIVSDHFGTDIIGGFDRLGDDVIEFEISGISSVADLDIAQIGADTEIRTATGVITLWNVDANTLGSEDFIFS